MTDSDKHYSLPRSEFTTAIKSIIIQAPEAQCYETFYGHNLMNVPNKLECLSLTRLSSLVWVKPGAYPIVENLKGASLR